MKLSIINSIAILIIIILKIVFMAKDKITFKWNSTTWEKKKYGFSITLWQYKKSEAVLHGFNTGKRIVNLNWRNVNKINDDIKKAK